MIVAIPKEKNTMEPRVAATPSTVKDLIKSENYNLSQKIKLMAFEGTYPSRYDQNSKNIITKLNKKENCQVKDKINNIYFLICE